MAGKLTLSTLAEQVSALAEAVSALVPQEEAAPAKPRKSATRKPAKGGKSSASRKPRAAKPKPTVWIVKRSWIGEEPSARMIGAAIHYGIPAAKVEGLDKFDLSTLIGKTRKVKVTVED